MHSDSGTDAALLVKAALLERAFEYRSGREKQIESAVPGHPVSDLLALALERIKRDPVATKPLP